MRGLTSHPGLLAAWRRLVSDDIDAVSALAATCLRVDGGLPFAADESFVRPRFLPPAPGTTLGAFDPVGELIAAAAVRPDASAKDHRAVIVGLVHPSHRGHGIGTFLLRWSIAQGRSLPAESQPEVEQDRPRRLVVATEGLTDVAARLYERYGFVQEFAENVMRRDLRQPEPEAPLPPGITLSHWTPELAEPFYAAYAASFRDRPGFPNWSGDQWIDWATGDDAFRPEASFVAMHGDIPAGFIVCDEGWISQIGVCPAWRGRGLGAALLAAVLRHFRDAGLDEVLLDVNVNNPNAARLYARLGFEGVGRRARWTLDIA